MIHPLAATDGLTMRRAWLKSLEDKQDNVFPGADDEFEEFEIWEEVYDLNAPVVPGARHWTITFVIIAILLSAFTLIALVGLAQSDWLYGTYGNISQAQWDQIADLRDRLSQLGVSPEAVDALNDALLLPHPSTEKVLSNLRKAALALDQLDPTPTINALQTRLYALIGAIDSDHAGPVPTLWPTPMPPPLPTLTPIMDAPVVQS